MDTALGGKSHDVLDPRLGAECEEAVRSGEFDFVFLATPCAPYSTARTTKLYSRRGGLRVPRRWRAYKARADALAAFTARMIEASREGGALWVLENPADQGEAGSVAFWHEDHFPLWLQGCIARALAGGSARRTVAMCAFGAPWRKYTTFAFHPALVPHYDHFAWKGCDHGPHGHQERAYGRDESGASRAEAAGEYPGPLCVDLADGAMAGVEEARRSGTGRLLAAGSSGVGHAVGDGEGVVGSAELEATAVEGGRDGGRVLDGASLHPLVSDAVETARAAPPRFASTRNKLPLDSEHLLREPMPSGLIIAPRAGRRPTRSRRRPPLPRRREPGEDPLEGWRLPPREGHGVTRPSGKIHIEQLYSWDVYAREIESWLALADAAAVAIQRRRNGERVDIPDVPTRVVEAWQQPLWARGDVWDCSDPCDCKPVERSHAGTHFPGRRQIDRSALRAAADRLRWPDRDIVEQVCGGGVEIRSSCERITVLTFHHPGLLEHVEAAAEVVAKHVEEEWVEEPRRHLPYVPCRLQPRDVIMQDRYRVIDGEWEADGRPKVEHYLKPRVTTNSSHGGEDSVNAGVAVDARRVELPLVQWLARAVAICDEAGWRRVSEALDVEERRAREGGVEVRWARALCYCVDAESAYSFCPVQHADLWTQCFVWWSADGVAGFAVDRRMGFGGAFAPNRFERVSTLVTAYIASLQRDFDAAHPPVAACGWVRRRLEAMGLGVGTGRAADECAAAWRMIYIDDLCGTALGDSVPEPPEVAGIVIDPVATEALGATFAPAGTRVHVHAQLAVLGMSRMGLSAAPGKVTVGDGITALGFAVHSREGRLRCPVHKRATLLSAIADLEAEATGVEGAPSAGRREAERLTGKLCNLAQVFPELGASLQAGYALVHSAWAERARPRSLAMRAGSDTHMEWCSLLRLARELLVDNEGVALAPSLTFPARDDADTLLVVTDASGTDGVGGYAFSPAAPSEVWLVSEMWPEQERAARAQAELSSALRTSGSPRLAMPTAELFGSWAVAEAVVAATGRSPTAVLAVGDCQPACHALNRALGGAAQLRCVLRAARARCHSWLGVHVPRELNRDADKLTHPRGVAELAAEATAAGWTVHAIEHLPDHCWEVLREASRLPLRPEERGHYSA